MGALGRLLTVLGLIVILMIGATLARGPAGTLVAQWGDLHASTTMPVALGLFLAALVLAYYFGQLVFYLGGLPGVWRAGKGHKKREDFIAEVTGALAALRLGLVDTAQGKLAGMGTDEDSLQKLAAAARLAAGEDEVEVPVNQLISRKKGSGDWLSAAGSLIAARRAAEAQNWTGVAEQSAQGLGQAPESPKLLALRLKALINLDDLASAAALQERVAPYLSAAGQRELQALVAPGAKITRTADVPVLSATAAVRWQAWLGNADDDFPVG